MTEEATKIVAEEAFWFLGLIRPDECLSARDLDLCKAILRQYPKGEPAYKAPAWLAAQLAPIYAVEQHNLPPMVREKQVDMMEGIF